MNVISEDIILFIELLLFLNKPLIIIKKEYLINNSYFKQTE